MLTDELACFEKIKAELRTQYPQGGFVVIKGNEVAGVWVSRMDAIKIGLQKFGNVQFLVKNINDGPDLKLNFSRHMKFANAISHV